MKEKNAFGRLMITGQHRHVILQAHANLGLAEPKPWGSGEPWKDGDNDRYQAELEAIAKDSTRVEQAVERFGEEVQRREQVQAEMDPATWAHFIKNTQTTLLRAKDDRAPS
jgi:hypothetical protein